MSIMEPWLVMATTGKKTASHPSFGRTNLLDKLRDLVITASNGDLSEDIVV